VTHATQPNTASGQTAARGASQPVTFVPGYGRGNFGSGGFGSFSDGTGAPSDGTGARSDGTGAPSQGSSAGTTTEGTAAQQLGIVEIDTELKYQNAKAAGTGMVLTSDGEILTNNHVVQGSTSISVTISSTGATYTARVVGTDPTNDVAVLQ